MHISQKEKQSGYATRHLGRDKLVSALQPAEYPQRKELHIVQRMQDKQAHKVAPVLVFCILN